jgi:outer membrane receptor protein involved in Fe transport
VPLGGSGFKGRLAASADHASPLNSRIVAGLSGARFVRLSPGDSITTARASFSIESPRNWTGTIFVENATDEDGAVFGNRAVPAWSTRLRPRTVGLQVEYRF